ncbi:hypothetical protein C8R46DRAFT_1135533 [Mycena filopes]|nr:hypothetical protein C8R46DRAFT_1135533 [Mycena filopes]
MSSIIPADQYTPSRRSLPAAPSKSFLHLSDSSLLDHGFSIDFKSMTFPVVSPLVPRRARTQVHRTKSTYLGTSSIINIPTARGTVIPLRAVRDCTRPADAPGAATPPQLQMHHRRPSLLHRLIPSALHRRTSSAPAPAVVHQRPEPPAKGDTPRLASEAPTPPAAPTPSSPTVKYGIRSAKYGAKVPTAALTSTGAEAASRPVEPRLRRKVSRSFSGYFCPLETEPEDGETTPEGREAIDVNARMFERGWRYEAVEGRGRWERV